MNAPPTAELAQALFDHSTDALLIIDGRTARLLQANPTAQRLLGRDSTALCDSPLCEWLIGDSPERFNQVTQALGLPECCNVPDGLAIAHVDGGLRIPVALTIRPLNPGSALVQLTDRRLQRNWQEGAAESETELALLRGAIPAAVWCAERAPDSIQGDKEAGWQFRYLSPSVERVTGWPASFFRNGPQRFIEIIHPDDRSMVLSARAAFLLSPNRIFNTEMRVVGADGFVRWIRWDLQVTRDELGRAIRLDCVLTDINRPKIAELSLCESQRWLSRLLETSTNGVLILDLAGRITLANRAAEQITGLPNEALLDRDWNDLPWAPDSSNAIEGADLSVRTMKESELKLSRLDGRLITLSVNAAPLRDDAGRIVGVVVTLTDVSLRRQAEEAVRRSDQRYRRLFERNLAGVCRYTLEGKFLDANPAYARIFGYESPEEMRDVPGSALHADKKERDRKVQHLLKHGYITNVESRRCRKDGSEFWVLENVTLVDEAGTPTIEATLVDITERKRAEEALAQDHALLQTVLNSIPDAVFRKDRNGRYLGCNPAFAEYVGRSDAEIIGCTVSDLFSPEHAEAMLRDDAQVFASGKPLRVERHRDAADGQRVVELVLNPIFGENGTVDSVLGVGRDITERRQIEEQLREAGKMEGIGRLAGGVAHDFNNLLTIILGNISLLRSSLRADDSTELLVNCEQAAGRASELTNQLLGFARRKPLDLQPLDLNRRVAETAQLLRRTFDPNIRIHVQPQPNLRPILGDASHIGQVLMNLCLNARDAMSPRGGRIHIETANVVLVEPNLSNLDARTGEFVRLTISDDGPGIPPEIRKRIFEPFFTTKPLGKGTGLGLAVVFGIVKQHNGWIDCRSEPGKGTRFDIYLPPSVEESHSKLADTPLTPGKGNETILLVDDEPMIRELGRSILERQGYRVLQAEDGAVALDIFQQRTGEIDLVVLDLTMPNLSGREAFRRLREIDPNAGVLLSSGYSTDEFEPGELDGVLGFIPKPYRIDELAAAVRAALDRTHCNNHVNETPQRNCGQAIGAATVVKRL